MSARELWHLKAAKKWRQHSCISPVTPLSGEVMYPRVNMPVRDMFCLPPEGRKRLHGWLLAYFTFT